jgi:hypothetical protein
MTSLELKDSNIDPAQVAIWEAAVQSLWIVRGELNNVALPDLKAQLSLNEYPVTGGKDHLVQRCAEGLLFGKATCPQCQQHEMRTTSGYGYECLADGAWGKCNFIGKPLLSEFVVDRSNASPYIQTFNKPQKEFPFRTSVPPVGRIEKAAAVQEVQAKAKPALGLCF